VKIINELFLGGAKKWVFLKFVGISQIIFLLTLLNGGVNECKECPII
jgi:hypothetical protein